MPTCTAPGCDRPHRARGLCSTHYNQAHQPGRHRTTDVPCAYCATLTPTEPSRLTRYGVRYCSLICRDLAKLERGDPWAAGRAARRTCVLPPDHPARWYGERCEHDTRACARCQRPYLVNPASSRSYCSPRCMYALRSPRRRVTRRARVFERDNYRCYLCGKRCDRLAAVPHPDAPTIDHLIPRSLGGGNDAANLGTACFRCNCRRGARWDLPAPA